MAKIKLRPHHVAAIVEHYRRYRTLPEALAALGYTEGTITRSMKIVDDLLAHPGRLVEIIGNDEPGEDSICAVCDYNNDGTCTLPGSEEITPSNSADRHAAARLLLSQGTYPMSDFLTKRTWFHPKLRI